MPLYERYVDALIQVAEVPPVGSNYNKNTKKIVIDGGLVDVENENDDARLTKALKDKADDVMEDIKMEADCPSQNPDSKMAILDLNVWMSLDHRILIKANLEFHISPVRHM